MTRICTHGHRMVTRTIEALPNVVFLGCDDSLCFQSVTDAMPLPGELEQGDGLSEEARIFARMLENGTGQSKPWLRY